MQQVEVPKGAQGRIWDKDKQEWPMASASDFTPAGVKAAKASGAWKAKDEFVHIHIDDYKVFYPILAYHCDVLQLECLKQSKLPAVSPTPPLRSPSPGIEDKMAGLNMGKNGDDNNKDNNIV